MASKKKYFADDDAEDLVAYLTKRGESYHSALVRSKMYRKLKKSWQAYHGFFYSEGSHEVSFGGESGELVQLPVNQYQNFAQHIINMVTGTKPALKCRSVNTDSNSMMETTLANSLIDYYFRELKIPKHMTRAVEAAVILGEGFIKSEWNSNAGEISEYIEPDYKTQIDEFGTEVFVVNEKGEPEQKNPDEKSMPVYKGEPKISSLTALDVIYDKNKTDFEDIDWIIIRTWKNKYALANEYPEMAEKIYMLPTREDLSSSILSLDGFGEGTDVPVYEFMHKKNSAKPDGRHVIYLSSDIVLVDEALKYRKIPVRRITPRNFIGTNTGYTPMFDLLPLQDMFNSVISTIATNISQFGVQNIAVPMESNIKMESLQGGMNFLQYQTIPGSPNGGLPVALSLTQTPAEVYNFAPMLSGLMETIIAVSSSLRGDPANNIKSGQAMAMMSSQSLQYYSLLQQSYIEMLEDIGTDLIEILQDFCDIERVINITGKMNSTRAKVFKGEKIKTINKVVADVGNALSQTHAGRIQMADNLLQMNLIKNVNDYFSVLNTGNLDVMIQSEIDENQQMALENELLISGEYPVYAHALENHPVHINKHRACILDPMRKLDNELVTRVNNHIAEHLNLLRTVDPGYLAVVGIQPLGPAGGTPPNPNDTTGENPELGTLEVPPQQAPNSQLPSLPQPAQSPTGAPTPADLAPQGVPNV